MQFRFSNNSAISIYRFETIKDVAKKLVLPLKSGSVALSGGSTYKELCEAWAAMKPDLSKGWYCAVDERMVPFDHPDSNWGSVAAPLFAAGKVPEQCYNHYTSENYLRLILKNRFGTEPYTFDTIFLGVGTDGHTASIFPGTADISNNEKAVLLTKSPVGVTDRITLGPKVFSAARNVVTIMTGESKKQCIDWLLDEDMSKPFVSILSRRVRSDLYLDPVLHDYLQSKVKNKQS